MERTDTKIAVYVSSVPLIQGKHMEILATVLLAGLVSALSHSPVCIFVGFSTCDNVSGLVASLRLKSAHENTHVSSHVHIMFLCMCALRERCHAIPEAPSAYVIKNAHAYDLASSLVVALIGQSYYVHTQTSSVQ
jgi:hypothetical protein